MRMRMIALLTLLLFACGCELDGFLFNEEQINRYELPGNTIADSLLEPVTFQSGGNTLYGYWVKSAQPGRGMTMLYCHGNKHNIDEYWDRVLILHELGINLFIFDYRGFGRSEGTSTESSLFEDGEAAWELVQSRYAIPADSLCLYGYSLGNVVSIHLAAEIVTPLCLMAEAPFASANSLTQSATAMDLPALWLTAGRFDNALAIRNIQTPLILLHGADDDFVRFRDNGKVVYDNAPEPKSLVLVPGANHTDIPHVMGRKHYLNTVQEWIASGAKR